MDLWGKTALVTGASRGIGREIALALAVRGARLGLVARSRDGLEETKRLLGTEDAEIFCADLLEAEAIVNLARLVTCALGRVDILVNAAGVWHDDQAMYHGPRLPATPESQIRDVLGVGLTASMLLARQFLPQMIQQRAGKILHIACGFAGPHEAAGWLHYYVTNKAIEAFTRGLAYETREHEVQVNCIAPWFVATEPALRFFPAESETALDPKDVARLAAFLLTREADHISGQIIEVRSKHDHG
jgi:NAD(P)-dependent dehydrogenase (short-subunit alcohol dehydrogenase family)